jgi:hypothetical protein
LINQQIREVPARMILCHLSQPWWDFLDNMNLKTLGAVLVMSWLRTVYLSAQPTNPTPSTPKSHSVYTLLTMPGSPLGIAWGFLYGNLGVRAEQFMPQVRELAGGFTKIYLTWHQIEPQKGQYD